MYAPACCAVIDRQPAGLTGIQAAVASGLGITVLPTTAVLPEHSVCIDLPRLPPTELALIGAGGAMNAVQSAQSALVDFLREAVSV